MTKMIWLGQRLSDGLLYSMSLKEIESFFTCEQLIAEQLPKKCFSLDEKGISPDFGNKWTSFDIRRIIDVYKNELNKQLNEGFILLPYYLSNEAILSMYSKQTILNSKVFRCQLIRSLQMHIMTQANVTTPRWFVPYHSSWEDISNYIGVPFILQFDNTSSGMGTYLIKSKDVYLSFKARYGDADIATQYISDGYSCSTHIWISPKEIQIASPSVQIVEKKTLMKNNKIQTFNYRGNDFGLYHSRIGRSSFIEEQLYRIGAVYQKAGICGLLGVDYIIKDGEFFYNETNFRLQNSTSLLSFLQPKENNIISLLIGSNKKIAEVKNGFQYFATINTSHLISGYYRDTGEFETNFSSSCLIDINCYLVFASFPRNGTQNIRIIGLNTGSVGKGFINSNVSKFIERLITRYG